jgi:hypothetical protein
MKNNESKPQETATVQAQKNRVAYVPVSDMGMRRKILDVKTKPRFEPETHGALS